MPDASAIGYAKDFGIPAATFALGFLARFTMTRKESADNAQTVYQNSRDLMERQEQTYQSYIAAINNYVHCEKDVELDHFLSLASTGETYFYQLKIACDAILAGRVNPVARDNTLVPKIREATLKTLPEHYETLRTIAKGKGFKYEGELKRENYNSLYAVVERFGSAEAWQPVEPS